MSSLEIDSFLQRFTQATNAAPEVVELLRKRLSSQKTRRELVERIRKAQEHASQPSQPRLELAPNLAPPPPQPRLVPQHSRFNAFNQRRIAGYPGQHMRDGIAYAPQAAVIEDVTTPSPGYKRTYDKTLETGYEGQLSKADSTAHSLGEEPLMSGLTWLRKRQKTTNKTPSVESQSKCSTVPPTPAPANGLRAPPMLNMNCESTLPTAEQRRECEHDQ